MIGYFLVILVIYQLKNYLDEVRVMANHKKNKYIIQGTDDNIERFFQAMEILWNVKGLKIQKLHYKEYFHHR